MVRARSAAPTLLMAHPAPNFARPPASVLPALSPFSMLWPMLSAPPWALSTGSTSAGLIPATARFSAALVVTPISWRASGLIPACAASFSCWPRLYIW